MYDVDNNYTIETTNLMLERGSELLCLNIRDHKLVPTDRITMQNITPSIITVSSIGIIKNDIYIASDVPYDIEEINGCIFEFIKDTKYMKIKQ